MGVDIKQVKALSDELEYLNTALGITVTSKKYEDFSQVAFDIADQLDLLNSTNVIRGQIEEIYSKGLVACKKRHYVEKMVDTLSPKVELWVQKAKRENPNIDSLLYGYESKGFRNASIERLEALKLQLNLVEQRGFYALSKEKAKVKLQEDILLMAAELIQELSYQDGLVNLIIDNFKKIEDYAGYDYVTKPEEDTITLCYSVLLNSLIDLNYR